MHLGIFAKTFSRPTLGATLDAIVAHGLAHVQFNLSCVGLPTLPDEIDEARCLEIATAFRDRRLTMAAISGTFNMCDPDSRRLDENQRRLKALAAACASLGTGIITLSTGTRDPNDMWRWHGDNVRKDTWQALIRAMERACAIADRHQVVIAFEPEIHNVVNSVRKARCLLDDLKSDRLGVVIDPANLPFASHRGGMSEALDEAFDWLGSEIVLAHAKEPAWVHANESALHASRAAFRDKYLHSLRAVGFPGSVVIHGLDEADVAARVAFWRAGFDDGGS
jgi:sugar phosphate isomerase/epimerase